MNCPQCGNDQPLILVSVWARFRGDEDTDTDATPNGDHTWDDTSPAWCDSCHWQGLAGDLVREDTTSDAYPVPLDDA